VEDGVYHATFVLNDGVLPVRQVVTINVANEETPTPPVVDDDDKKNNSGGSSGCDTGAAFLALVVAGIAALTVKNKK
jgi:hypothetical protein